jgi:mRNA interferase HigB
MHIISHKRLKEFWHKHPDAEPALQTWYIRTKLAHWRNLAELKHTFPAADQVARLTVFNIGGNNYRLITRVEFERQEVYIRAVLTHAEYDKGSWKNDPWY